MKYSAIIVAGGHGKRFESATPKQFQDLNGKPLLLHSMHAFAGCAMDIRLIIVLPREFMTRWKALSSSLTDVPPHTLVEGGIQRFHSVNNGLEQIRESELVAIHDAARPMVTSDLIKKLFDAASKHGAAVPTIQMRDSIGQTLDGCWYQPVPRSGMVSVQTPQCFHTDIILEAYKQPYHPQFTDDASVVNAAGIPIYAVEGQLDNIKLTFPEDIYLARTLMDRRQS